MNQVFRKSLFSKPAFWPQRHEVSKTRREKLCGFASWWLRGEVIKHSL